MAEAQRRGISVGRRTWMKLAGAAVAWGALGVNTVATAAALTSAQRDKLTPEQILALMKKGNERFLRGERATRNDYLAQQRATAGGQHPAAVLLSCIDSRAPAEMILDLGIGDVFNCRVAGNIANDDILGSMVFACKLAGAKVVLVMGHTACGAVKGAIDHAELGNLTALLQKIEPAVGATPFAGERTSANPAFVDAVARTNVERTTAELPGQSPVLAAIQRSGAVLLAGAMYDLASGRGDFF